MQQMDLDGKIKREFEISYICNLRTEKKFEWKKPLTKFSSSPFTPTVEQGPVQSLTLQRHSARQSRSR